MKPWSSTYWPDRSGGIANRYTNKVAGGIDILNGVPFSKREFKRDFRRLEKNLLTMDEKELNKLSPAEKYDLIVNDLKFTFSKSVWKKIDHNRDHWGRTTYWTGICHGWAPASIHFPRPKSTVTVPVLNGAKYLDLYPSDIKALGSFLWANMGNYPTGDTLFAGNRCNKKKPLRDPDTGLIGPITNFTRNENECSDVDPLLFHIVLLNRLALQSKSFIIDVDYNEPVNNHPVTGFELKYFNPKTGKYSDYKSAKIQLSKIERDALKDHRARNTNQVLGIEAKVYTAHWRQPIRNRTDSVENDKDLVMVYKYELDLDSKDNPLKGHWRAARRNGVKGKVRFPDFIWDFKSDFTPREYFSSISNELHLDLMVGVDERWSQSAVKNSSNKIVLLHSNRMTHRHSRKAGLDREIKRIAQEEGLKTEIIAKRYANDLDTLGISRKKANPQLLSKVVIELFNLSSSGSGKM